MQLLLKVCQRVSKWCKEREDATTGINNMTTIVALLDMYVTEEDLKQVHTKCIAHRVVRHLSPPTSW